VDGKDGPHLHSPPRHRNRDRFGFHDPEGAWVPYEVTEGRLVFACGHGAKIAVGSAPGMDEETIRLFVAKAAAGVCAVCWSIKGRLRYQAHGQGNSAEEKRERD
jgi:hypothetical protein